MTKKAIRFFMLAYAISWAFFAIGYFLLGMKDDVSFSYLVFVFMWGPFIAAIICTAIDGVGFGRLNMSPSLNKWMFLAWLCPLFLLGLAGLISMIFGMGVVPYHEAIMDPENVVPIPVYYIMFGLVFIVGGLFNGLFSISEELGFRGYALFELLPVLGFWKTSFVIGVLWGLWHSPLILAGYNYPGFPYLGILMITAVTCALSPVMNFLTLKSGNVWAACLFHGSFNTVAGISVMMMGSNNFPYHGLIGIFGVLASLCFCALVFMLGRFKFLPDNRSLM